MYNGKYLYETHCHTTPASKCAAWSGDELADYYKSCGYDGVFITDHFFNGNTGIEHGLPWEEKVEQFCKGYETAKKRGDEIGLDVFFGFEYNRDGAEFLVYGLDKQWLISHPEIMELRICDLYSLVKRCGGAFIQAHPFREAGYLEKIAVYPKFCDGAEVINTANNPVYNENAIWYAKRFGLYMTCGSDAHWVGRDDMGGVLIDRKLTSAADYVSIIDAKQEITLFNMKDYGYNLKNLEICRFVNDARQFF